MVEVENRKLKQCFRDLAISRKFSCVALRKLLRSQGGRTSERGTLTGSALRLYAKIKAAIADQDCIAIVEELERSEKRALQAFCEAAAREPLGEFRGVIQTQARAIRESLEDLSALRRDLARHARSRADANGD